MTEDLAGYSTTLDVEVLATAEADEAPAPEAFTRIVLQDLEMAGEVENTFVAYYRSTGVETSGYGQNDSLGSLDLFVTHFRQSQPRDKLSRAQTETYFTRLLSFVRRCVAGLASAVEDSSDVHDMCIAVQKTLPEATRIRLFVLTNAVATTTSFAGTEFDGIPVSRIVWDLPRLHRLASSGALSEPIVVEFDPPLPALATPVTDRNYSVFLTIMPGQQLATLYGQYGTRLLELNVRSFLQTRGTVNRGIRETILTSPDRFLAYNNGITATASNVDFVDLPDGGSAIARIHDLQVVNGGQTTASLHYTQARDKADLSQVHVQMKLTRVSPDQLDEIVPEISKYSNTQNKVTGVDFSSNHPLHVAIEKVTRSLWAPAADGSGQETKWFYERARGQYADALARERTPSAQRRFKIVHPTSQKFTKSDAAKFLQSWDQQPHFVSRGAEKNFREFMIRIGEDLPTVDQAYCRQLLAKAILFKSTDRISAEHEAGSYKLNVTTYTIARLSLATQRLVDLEQIWRDQRISPALYDAIHNLCGRVKRAVMTPRRGNHIGEWAKKPECWEIVSLIPWKVPDTLAVELCDEATVEPTASGDGTTHGDVVTVMAVPATDWFAVAHWAKESQNLLPWQRQIASTVGRYINNQWTVTDRQAAQAIRLMDEARRLGFRSSTDP